MGTVFVTYCKIVKTHPHVHINITINFDRFWALCKVSIMPISSEKSSLVFTPTRVYKWRKKKVVVLTFCLIQFSLNFSWMLFGYFTYQLTYTFRGYLLELWFLVRFENGSTDNIRAQARQGETRGSVDVSLHAFRLLKLNVVLFDRCRKVLFDRTQKESWG